MQNQWRADLYSEDTASSTVNTRFTAGTRAAHSTAYRNAHGQRGQHTVSTHNSLQAGKVNPSDG